MDLCPLFIEYLHFFLSNNHVDLTGQAGTMEHDGIIGKRMNPDEPTFVAIWAPSDNMVKDYSKQSELN